MESSTTCSAVGEAFRPPLSEAARQQARRRNRLPLMEYAGAKAYLLTLATAGRISHFSDAPIFELCLEELRLTATKEKFEVLAYCFMPDHVHLLVAGTEPESNLVDFVKRFKQRTGFWFKNRCEGGLKASPAGLWQRSYHDHILRSEERLRLAAAYVINNPIEAGLADESCPHPYAGRLTRL